MSKKRNLDYYQNSIENDAVSVRCLIWSWYERGADRNYPLASDYLQDPLVYKRAVKCLNMEFIDE